MRNLETTTVKKARETMKIGNWKSERRGPGLNGLGMIAGLAAIAVSVAACDTDVTNPGPVQEEFLQEAAAQPALVSGAARAFSQAQNWIGYTSGAITREVHPAGSTGSFGVAVRWQAGRLEADDDGLDTHWEQAQRARWLAERSIEILEDVGPLSQELLADAYLWAGFSNRLLGENYCETTIDGSAPQPNTVHFERGEQHFTRAMELGTSAQQAVARAGRASIRVSQGDWGGAVSDANQVGDGVLFEARFFSGFGDDQRNRIFFASASEPYKAHTVWNTKYAEIGFSEDQNPDGDPRTPWRFTDEVGDAAIPCCGTVSWWPPTKYDNSASAVPIAKSEEMRLIEAEAMLRDGNFQAAIDHINTRVRGPAGVDPVSASTLDEAWAILKEERGIALWLEGRRLADLRRWDGANTPGALHPLEIPSGSSSEGTNLERMDLCFPIPPTEQETNPNVDLAT